nr:glutamyl-trna(gln) amidotransferase subunit a [Quercus suber]
MMELHINKGASNSIASPCSTIGLVFFFTFAVSLVLAYDAREATISSTHHDLFTGQTTCREIVSSFISRIEALNNHTNAIISLDPQALNLADELDTQLKKDQASYGRLFCIPTLLKDNYDTVEVPTTGGNLHLVGSRPSLDAPSVTVLRNAGAVIIGKANLHELALEGLSVSSLGGQTINPYDSTRTPGGSSGGTGAAVAASFAVWGTGSDTVNSLRSPASANSLFSCRPTRGLISRTGIIPVSYTQDAIGPIGRSIEDIAIALSVMSSIGYDRADNATGLAPPCIRGVDYVAGLTTGALSGIRLGLLEGFFNRTASIDTTPVNVAMEDMVAQLEAAGASIIRITDPTYDATALATFDTQRYEYRQNMDSYLQRPSLRGSHPQTLNEIYARPPGKFLVIPAQYEFVKTALISSTSNTTYDTIQSGITNLTLAIASTFATHSLDAIIYPEQKNLVVPIGAPSQKGRNGILAALTGSPVITVPVGFSERTSTAPQGVPIGMEILGRPWSEARLLQLAWQIQKRIGQVRRAPEWAKQTVPTKEYAGNHMPRVAPDTTQIPAEYPHGTL